MLLWLAAFSAAHGAGYYTTDVGMRSLGRGTAFVAGADDLTALYYNPAALTRLRTPQAMVDIGLDHQAVTFERDPATDPEGNTETYEPVKNEGLPYVVPTVGISHTFGTRNGTFAFGFYPPYAPDFAYDPDGPQRYVLIDSTIIQLTAGPSVAWRFFDMLSVGVGLSWNWLRTGQVLKITAYDELLDQIEPGGTVLSDYDVTYSLLVTDPFTISGNAGLLLEPPSGRFAIGASVQPPIRFDLTGPLTADFSDHPYYTGTSAFGQLVKDAQSGDDSVTLSLTMPLVLRAGALVRPIEGLEIEGAFVWQGWSVIDELRLTDVYLYVDTTTNPDLVLEDDIVLDAGYQDAWSARLGGEYDLDASWTLRAGGFYETSAVPTTTVGVNLVDGDKVGYGVGFTWRRGAFAFDLAWSQSFIFPLDVTDSTVHQIWVDTLPGNERPYVNDGVLVGNGTYRSRFDLFGVGVTWAFGSAAEG